MSCGISAPLVLMSFPKRFSTPTDAQRSDPSAFAGTRMPEDLEESPARRPRPSSHAATPEQLPQPEGDNSHMYSCHGGPSASPSMTPQRLERRPNFAMSGTSASSFNFTNSNVIRSVHSGDDAAEDMDDAYFSSHRQHQHQHVCAGRGGVASGRTQPLSRLFTEYSATDHIGNGNFGSVVRGIYDLDGCEYAVKKTNKPLLGESDLQHRMQEVYALSGCSGKGASPYVLRYFDAWIEDEGYVCIRTEYLRGGNLRRLCVAESDRGGAARRGDPSVGCAAPRHPATSPLVTPSSYPYIDAGRAWEFLFQMSMGLNSIHTHHHMAHLDVKPDNIFVSVSSHLLAPSAARAHGAAGGEQFPAPPAAFEYTSVSYKLGDFGLARPAGASSDEQYKGLNDDEGDKRYLCPYLLSSARPYRLLEADVYSLGASVVEVMGCPPVAAAASEYEISQWLLDAMPPSPRRRSPSVADDTAGEPAHLPPALFQPSSSPTPSPSLSSDSSLQEALFESLAEQRQQCRALANVVASMLRRNPTERPSTLAIATAAFRGMQHFRSLRRTHAPASEPSEVLEAADLRERVAEMERLLDEMSAADAYDDYYDSE